MSNRLAQLQRAGIHPYGSDALTTYEKHITRYLSREYKRLTREKSPDVISNQGSMWAETPALMENHYDEDIHLFRNFLDQTFMAYTMAYYGETAPEIMKSEVSLDQAQRQKFDCIARRSGITGEERILNIGCGFGSLEVYLFEQYPNLRITSVTPSKTQLQYIRHAIASPDHVLHGKQFDLIEGDFDRLSLEQLGGAESYDLAITIGVLEAVNNLSGFFAKVSQLVRMGGRTFHHLITPLITIPRFLDSKSTMIDQYFPGGKIWPYHTLTQQQEFFRLEQSWFVNGMNYYRTLDSWHARFWDNLDNLYPERLNAEQVKHWNDYFVLCKACFAPADGEVYGNGHFLFRKG